MKIPTEKKKVLVFGTFDGVHDGHRHFLRRAKKYGDFLVVAVAKDTTVKILKGVLPQIPLPNRIMNLKKEKIADLVVPGDQVIGKWKIIKRLKPDIICFGYDQLALKDALQGEKARGGFNWKLKFFVIDAFKGKELHSSFLKKRKSL
jgi:cytidyltransferase-like protein